MNHTDHTETIGFKQDDRRITGLYIHVPFCKSPCLYCDFVRQTGHIHPQITHRYVQRVTQELKRLYTCGALDDIATIYIGGGTPTYLGNGLVSIVRTAIQCCTSYQSCTVEANPESAHHSLLCRLHAEGVTRISLGVQSFDDRLLKQLHRAHTSQQAIEVLDNMRRIGFERSLDLIAGLPNQSLKDFDNELNAALRCDVDHISCYALSVEDNTPLKRLVDCNQISLPNDDAVAVMLEHAHHRLGSQGFHRYEISNYARIQAPQTSSYTSNRSSCANSAELFQDDSPSSMHSNALTTHGTFDQSTEKVSGISPSHHNTLDCPASSPSIHAVPHDITTLLSVCALSSHNMVYWHTGSYIGIGPGAVSRLYQEDYQAFFATSTQEDNESSSHTCWDLCYLGNTEHLNDWITSSTPYYLQERQTLIERVVDYLMLALRTSPGVSCIRLNQIEDIFKSSQNGALLCANLHACLRHLQNAHLILWDHQGIRPTNDGFILGNEIAHSILEILHIPSIKDPQ